MTNGHRSHHLLDSAATVAAVTALAVIVVLIVGQPVQVEGESARDASRPALQVAAAASSSSSLVATPPHADEAVATGRRFSGRQRIRQQLSDEQLDHAMQIISELYPERAERFAQLREDNPQQFERALSQNARGIAGLVMLKQHNPEMYELKIRELRIERKIEELAAQIAASDPESAHTRLLKQRLSDLVREQVDLSLRVRAEELVTLERHIKSMREQLTRDAVNRDQLIENRIQQVLAGVRD